MATDHLTGDVVFALVVGPCPVRAGPAMLRVYSMHPRGPVPRARPGALRLVGFAGVVGVLGLILHSQGYAADGLSAFAPSNGALGQDQVGDLRALVDGLLEPATGPDRPFTLDPSFGVQELVTDNVYQVARPRQADLVTSLQPQLVLSGQTRLVQANVTYAPDIQLYAKSSQQNQVAQQFNGQALVTAVPDTLFLQLRGYGAQQSASGAYGQNTQPYNSSRNRSNTQAFEVSPYATHRFGGDGTLQAGFVFNSTNQTGASTTGALTQQDVLNAALVGRALGNSATQSTEEYASFTTGENFGRFSNALRLDNTDFTGSGGSVLNRAHRSTAIDDFGYGVNRSVALLGSLGWEDIAYAAVPPITIRDVVWSGGVRLTPNENSTIVVKYGHKDGFNAASLNASYALTPRLRLFGAYSEGLTSSQQEISDNLDSSSVDQYGNTVSTATGAPVLVADQLLALQNDLYRLKRLSVTAVSTYLRDVFSLTVERETRRLVASGPGVPGYSDQGVQASFSWSHELTPALTGTARVSYSSTTAQIVPSLSSETVGLAVQTSYAFTPTLTGTAGYYLTNQSSNLAGGSILQNAVIVGLRKSL